MFHTYVTVYQRDPEGNWMVKSPWSAAEVLLRWHPPEPLILQKGLEPANGAISSNIQSDMSWRNVVENHMGPFLFLWTILREFPGWSQTLPLGNARNSMVDTLGSFNPFEQIMIILQYAPSWSHHATEVQCQAILQMFLLGQGWCYKAAMRKQSDIVYQALKARKHGQHVQHLCKHG